MGEGVGGWVFGGVVWVTAGGWVLGGDIEVGGWQHGLTPMKSCPRSPLTYRSASPVTDTNSMRMVVTSVGGVNTNSARPPTGALDSIDCPGSSPRTSTAESL